MQDLDSTRLHWVALNALRCRTNRHTVSHSLLGRSSASRGIAALPVGAARPCRRASGGGRSRVRRDAWNAWNAIALGRQQPKRVHPWQLAMCLCIGMRLSLKSFRSIERLVGGRSHASTVESIVRIRTEDGWVVRWAIRTLVCCTVGSQLFRVATSRCIVRTAFVRQVIGAPWLGQVPGCGSGRGSLPVFPGRVACGHGRGGHARRSSCSCRSPRQGLGGADGCHCGISGCGTPGRLLCRRLLGRRHLRLRLQCWGRRCRRWCHRRWRLRPTLGSVEADAADGATWSAWCRFASSALLRKALRGRGRERPEQLSD